MVNVRDRRTEFRTLCLDVARRRGDGSEQAVEHWFDTSKLDLSVSTGKSQGDYQDNSGPAHMLIVPGLLGDSVRALVAPFMCARQGLTTEGRDIRVTWLNGRSGCTRNAARLRTVVLEEAARTGKPIDLVGYSKGCADALHMLGDWPDTHAALRSLTSLGGVVHGTPLAESTPSWLNKLLPRLPLPGLGQGDGRAIDDLTPERRRRWLNEHPLPDNIRYLSIVANPSPARISRVLRTSWRQLAKHDPRNDSQVIAQDALLPGSELLAVLDADHWAIALPVAERSRLLATLLVTGNEFPRATLLEALMDYLALPAGTERSAAPSARQA